MLLRDQIGGDLLRHRLDAALPLRLLQPRADHGTERHQTRDPAPVGAAVFEHSLRYTADEVHRVRLRLELQPLQHP